MGRKRKKQTTRAADRARGVSNSRRRRRASRGVNPLVWLGGVLGVVAVLGTLILWQSDLFAPSPVVSRGADPADLLPLAEPRSPLRGTHDPALIPEQTPAPQSASVGVPPPQLDLPSTSHDFGRIPKRPDVAHVFAVQNTGTDDLLISDLVTSCGCTTAELSSSLIPPGQRADLTVTFDPDYHEIEGEVSRLVWFATNDPTQPWVEVRITADVEP